MTGTRKWFWFLLLYFALATLANAVLRARGFDARSLDHRAFDYGWELGLPWRATQGEWVGRDFDYPIGPLWQALAFAGTLGGRLTDARAVGGLHVAFPMASLALAALLAFQRFRDEKKRALAFGALALFALHDDVRSLRSLVSFAVVLGYAPFEPADPTRERRSLRFSGVCAALSLLLSFETGVLACLSLASMLISEAIARRSLAPALARAREAAAAFVATLAAIALVYALAHGSLLTALRGWLRITGSYAVVMVEGRHGLGLAPLVAFVGLALGLLFATWTRRYASVVGGVLLAGTLPLLARALIRSDAEHVYAALLPLASALTVLGLEAFERRPFLASGALLLATTFALGWFGSRKEVPTAWKPSAFLALVRPAAPAQPYQHDVTTILAFAREHRGACLVLPERAVVVHPLSDVRGPTVTALRWTPAMKERLAHSIERERCPLAVRQLSSFDFPSPWKSFAFGADFLAQSLNYEPLARLGPATFVSRLRPAPLAPARRALGTDYAGVARSLPVGGSIRYTFERPVAWENLVALDYTLDVPLWRRFGGGTPWMKLAFYAGDERLGDVTALADLAAGERAQAVVPVHAEVGEWRWAAGHEPRERRRATALEVIAEARPLSPQSVSFVLHGLEELTPPEETRPETHACEASVDLLELARSGHGYARGVPLRVDGEALLLAPNAEGEPLAEAFLPVRPCMDSCLFAELGVEARSEGAKSARFEVHVIDDWEKPRFVEWSGRAGVSPAPVQIPLGTFHDRDVLVRFGTWPLDGAGAPARVYRPRVGPCRSQSLLQGFYDGKHTLLRGEAEPRGDTVRLSVAKTGKPPTEVRVPLAVQAGECLAYDVSSEGGGSEVATSVEVALLVGNVSVRLSRDHVRAGQSVSHKDVQLAEVAGRTLELRMAAWGLDPTPTAIIARLRKHRCGDGAPWGFGAERR